jgi:hypothetical protein
MLRIRIPDRDFPSRSRIRYTEIKKKKDFLTKKLFLSPQKYDPRCSSRIPEPDFYSILDPRVKKSLGDPGSLIHISNTAFTYKIALYISGNYVQKTRLI